jgi:serralysin
MGASDMTIGAAFDGVVQQGSATPTAEVFPTLSPGINGVLGTIRWRGDITYSDPNSASDYQKNYSNDRDDDGDSAQSSEEKFGPLSADQLATTHAALDDAIAGVAQAGFSVEGFTDLNINYISGGSGLGTIRLANSNDPKDDPMAMDPDPGTAYGGYPGTRVTAGDAFFGGTGRNPTTGNFDYVTVLHEIGHTLGLTHGHPLAFTGEVDSKDIGALPDGLDSEEFSIMTYRDFVGDSQPGNDTETWSNPQTFMMFDIAALQHMYGADFTTNSGNTTYSWSPANGETRVNTMVALDPGGATLANRIFLTIWDGGGTDTYDLSLYTTDLEIDLTPGGHSTFSAQQLANLGRNAGELQDHFARGNVFNALQYQGDPRSLIENAIGGSGSDRIFGNHIDNVLNGRLGPDLLNGRLGLDTADYSASPAGVRVNLEVRTEAAAGGHAEGDVLREIENLLGSDHNDVLTGDAGPNTLRGRGGDDVLAGLGFQDLLIGGDDTDTADYSDSPGGVSVSLEPGEAGRGGDAKDDILNSIENLVGSNLKDEGDILTGNAGNNVLTGLYGDDILDGGAGRGTDTANYEASPGGVVVSLKAGLGLAGEHAGGDVLRNIENLHGSIYDDELIGDDRVNLLDGLRGDDLLAGLGGADILQGNQGGDTADYSRSREGVRVNLATGVCIGGHAQDDELRNIEGLWGSDFDDSEDVLVGDAGVNFLTGLAGNDHLWGGQGNDVFRFAPGAGEDRIHDFGGDFGDDTCRLRFGDRYDTWDEIQAVATEVNDNVQITLESPRGAPTVIWLLNTRLNSLGADDFDLA